MARTLVDEMTALPNLLTLARIALIPAVLAFIDNSSPLHSFIAALLFLAASLTDLLDGFLARRRGQVSILGKFLDPLADKLIVMAVLVTLVGQDRVEAWVVVLLLARELAVTGLRSIASSEGIIIAAGAEGKRKMAMQVVGICFLLAHFKYRMLFTDVWVDFRSVGLLCVYISLVFSLFSAVEYLQLFARALGKGTRSSRGAQAP